MRADSRSRMRGALAVVAHRKAEGETMSNGEVQYAGRWSIPGVDGTINGVLRVSRENRRLHLELTAPFGRNSLSERLLPSEHAPCILGELFTGHRVTLLECERVQSRVQFGHHAAELVRADYAFWGLCDAQCDGDAFRGGVFDFGETVQWAGLCHYKMERGEDAPFGSMRWEKEDDFEISIGAGVKVTVTPVQGSISLDSFATELKLEQHVKVRIQYDDVCPWSQVMTDADWFRRFVEMGMGCAVGIEEAEYLHPSVIYPPEWPTESDDRLWPCAVSPRREGLGVGHGGALSYYYLFNLSEARECGALAAWFDKRERLEPIIELYGLVYSDRVPSAEALFLNLTQALETLHARFYAANMRAYLSRVDELCACAGDGAGGETLRHFLCDEGQQKTRGVYLKSRLSDLLYADGVRPVEPGDVKFMSFPERLVATRNYYTHYDPKRKDGAFGTDEIPLVNSELIALLEYHLMVLVGFDSSLAAERVRRRRGC